MPCRTGILRCAVCRSGRAQKLRDLARRDAADCERAGGALDAVSAAPRDARGAVTPANSGFRWHALTSAESPVSWGIVQQPKGGDPVSHSPNCLAVKLGRQSIG